jgi:hypothetical protein
METSLILRTVKDPQAQNLIAKFSHFTDDELNVFVHFDDPKISNRYKVAQKLHDGSRIQADQSSMFYELMEKIIQDNDDVSVPNLNRIMLKEVERYHELRFESNKNLFFNEITKFKKFQNQYAKMNVFETSTKGWQSMVFEPLQQLSENKILRMDIELLGQVLDLQEAFNSFSDGREKAIHYEKLIDKFLQHVKFDSKGVKKIKDLFVENLTFEKAAELPTPQVETIFKMLFERHKFESDKYELRQFENIDAMILAIKPQN